MLDYSTTDGVEVHWFARDSIGQLAVFTSAGSRVLPEIVLKRINEHKEAASVIQRWPVICKSKKRFLGSKKGIWHSYAQRGLFAFDFFAFDNDALLNGEYSLEAEPVTPLKITQVKDSSLARLLESVSFKSAVFSKKLNIDMELLKKEGLPLRSPLV